MTGTARHRRMEQHGENGAVVLEFAIILPVLLALIFGIITSALAWNRHLVITHDTRITSRYGSTLPVSSLATLDGWIDVVMAYARANDEGTFSGDALLCVAYVDDTTARHRVDTPTAEGTPADGECFADGLAAGSGPRVQVAMERDDTVNWFLGRRTVTLRARSVTPHDGT